MAVCLLYPPTHHGSTKILILELHRTGYPSFRLGDESFSPPESASLGPRAPSTHTQLSSSPVTTGYLLPTQPDGAQT